MEMKTRGRVTRLAARQLEKDRHAKADWSVSGNREEPAAKRQRSGRLSRTTPGRKDGEYSLKERSNGTETDPSVDEEAVPPNDVLQAAFRHIHGCTRGVTSSGGSIEEAASERHESERIQNSLALQVSGVDEGPDTRTEELALPGLLSPLQEAIRSQEVMEPIKSGVKPTDRASRRQALEQVLRAEKDRATRFQETHTENTRQAEAPVGQRGSRKRRQSSEPRGDSIFVASQRHPSPELATPNELQKKAMNKQTRTANPMESQGDEEQSLVNLDADAKHATELFSPPKLSAATETVSVPSKSLQSMLSSIKRGGWTADHFDSHWEEGLLEEAENTNRWRQLHAEKVSDPRCWSLLVYAHFLWHLCCNCPKAPDFDGQAKMQRQLASKIQKAIRNCLARVDEICTALAYQHVTGVDDDDYLEKRNANIAESLQRIIIPWLVETLKQAFLLGGAAEGGDEMALPESGALTASSLQIVLQLVGWIGRLFASMIKVTDTKGQPGVGDATEHSGEEDSTDSRTLHIRMKAAKRTKFARYRSLLGKHIRDLERELEGLKGELGSHERRSKWKEQAMKRDEAARLQRQKQVKKRHAAHKEQMQMFIASTQRWRGESSHQGRRDIPDDDGDDGDDDDDHYTEEHDGWQFWEDDTILTMLRRVHDPELRILTAMVPGRRLEEVRQRVIDMKLRMRRKYEQLGRQPPQWCY